jgi:outer membrane lipoprotein SlyB
VRSSRHIRSITSPSRAGTTESIRQVDKQKYTSGAVVGGLAGPPRQPVGVARQVAAMIVGAVGGAVVGNEMQKNQTS